MKRLFQGNTKTYLKYVQCKYTFLYKALYKGNASICLSDIPEVFWADRCIHGTHKSSTMVVPPDALKMHSPVVCS